MGDYFNGLLTLRADYFSYWHDPCADYISYRHDRRAVYFSYRQDWNILIYIAHDLSEKKCQIEVIKIRQDMKGVNKIKIDKTRQYLQSKKQDKKG